MSRSSKTVKITKRIVDAIRTDGTDFYVFDSELIGFGVRVRKTGGMSYIARYRAGFGKHAPVRRVTIAKVGKITPDQARDAAKDILASVVKGQDPAKDRTGDRTAVTFAILARNFLAHIEAKRKPNTLSQYTHMLAAYAIPQFGPRKAVAITSSDVATLHLSLRAKGTTANRVRDVISSMYGWAMKAKVLPKMENPATGIEKFKEHRRDRFLTSEEIGRLGAAIREAENDGIPWEPDPTKKMKHSPKVESRRVKIDPAVAAAIRLFLFTGARLREILHLTWDMVDLERGLLLLPDSKTGEKAIILNGPAQLILAELPRVDRYVIPGKLRPAKNGKKPESKPRSDLKRPWTMVRRRAGLAADIDNPSFRVRIHDLRHTHASVGVGSNMSLPIIGRLLGHAQARTTERYAHLETDPLRKASNAIGNKINDALGDRDEMGSGEVVLLRTENG